jgi:hypothetical protein
MPESRIADLFRFRNRYLRSVNLERDFNDGAALEGYVVTPQVRQSLGRLIAGLAPDSGQRAWRITGDYGTGKSSFALVLAHLLAGERDELPDRLRSLVDFRRLRNCRPRLLPVLVTGARESLVASLLRSLKDALESTCGRGRTPRILGRLNSLANVASRTTVPDAAVIAAINEAGEYVTGSGKGTGILIILDELGKFLEFAAAHPDQQDIYFLQSLAEAASRSGDAPLFVVGLLHQGFHAYADQLSQAAQREWEKVAGRFEELLFNQPLDQTATLIVEALNVQHSRLPSAYHRHAEAEMAAAIDLGWYGAGASRSALISHAPGLFPLHATVLPVLVRLFSRFGQNERSLFSFLMSNEPFALRAFAEQPLNGERCYRIHDLYDYARAAFGHRLGVQSYRSHWNQIESVVASFPSTDELELQVLKTVGLLNMLDVSGLIASEAAIVLSVAGRSSAKRERVKQTLAKLHKANRVLYYRGEAGGYCLWPHTSVNLERAYDEASKALASPSRISTLIQDDLETRPLVARRHYIKTGNLRHFEVKYSSVPELGSCLDVDTASADGRVLVPLCETEEERQIALDFARSDQVRERPQLLIAVPKPLGTLAGLVHEARRWDWIGHNVPELTHDSYAAEEVSRQIAASKEFLHRRIQSFVGLRQFTEKMELQWFWKAEKLIVSGARDLLTELSQICDQLYAKAPRIHSELVNRRSLSSAAAAGRMRLIERMFKSASQPFLGMDTAKKPPEMAMYLSVLRRTNLHQETRSGFRIGEPHEKHDPCRLRPALQRIMELLEERGDSRMRVSDLFAELRRPPYGVRDGLHPLLLAAFSLIYERDLAFYENDGFLRHVSGDEFLRMTKAPETFEIQLCRIAGLRGAIFERLLSILQPGTGDGRKADILDVVRPLCVFAAQLPAYTHKTNRLANGAAAVRDALLAAREPSALLFNDLPRALGFQPFGTADAGAGAGKDVPKFVKALKDALDELKAAYPELLRRMKSTIVAAFGVPDPFDRAREVLAAIAASMVIAVTEPQLKAFCLRLADTKLPETEWLESVGSLVCAKPPSKWLDRDAEMFNEELPRLAARFQRVESVTFANRKRTGNGSAVRIAVTKPDGSELDRVLYVSVDEEPKVEQVETAVAALLARTERVGIAGASRAIWKAMSKLKGKADE